MPGVRESFTCSFSACRTGIRRCWRWVQCHKPITGLVLVIEDQYNVLCLGLTGAGKSTLLAQLVGEPLTTVEPTNGFNIKTIPFKNTVVSIKELGGSCSIQRFWNNYFNDKHGILFVVDASSPDLGPSIEVLKLTLNDIKLKGKPCLIIGTHIDLKDAKSADELEKHFAPVMHNRKWAVTCCCHTGSNGESVKITAALEMLIELMATKSEQ
ncbi:ADP-ribosylation factor-like protein 15 [Halotydeus destructor]|nr:ADP-ribosylation factor-like protein 15 [Halotydeus destructor]